MTYNKNDVGNNQILLENQHLKSVIDKNVRQIKYWMEHIETLRAKASKEMNEISRNIEKIEKKKKKEEEIQEEVIKDTQE